MDKEMKLMLSMVLGMGFIGFFYFDKLRKELESQRQELVHVKSAAMGVRG